MRPFEKVWKWGSLQKQFIRVLCARYGGMPGVDLSIKVTEDCCKVCCNWTCNGHKYCTTLIRKQMMIVVVPCRDNFKRWVTNILTYLLKNKVNRSKQNLNNNTIFYKKHKLPAIRAPTPTQNVPTWRSSSSLLTSSLRELTSEEIPCLLKVHLMILVSWG